MIYKGWDKHKINRGRGRGNWSRRGRGHNRMPIPNQFLQNHPWPNSINYNNYHVPHHEPNSYYYNSRHPKAFHTPFHGINNLVAKPSSPLPGSEEYTQNKIQQTSDLIKRQLNIDSETCNSSNLSLQSNVTFSECLNNNIQNELPESDINEESTNLSIENRRAGRKRCRTPEIIDVQEIHDKIIKHISSLSYNKKINLVNQNTSRYDIAIQEVQRQKRLQLSRALRDMSKRETQSSNDGEVINAIIPDIGIKIEDLPNDIIAELSNCLNIDLDDQLHTLVDPELCFKQAEEILNVNFEGDENSFKLFQSDTIKDEIIDNCLNKGNEETENILDGEISTINYDMLNKEQSKPQLISNPNIENVLSNCDEGVSMQNCGREENNDNSEDDYSKDFEFNNFCFENFDVNKSYLAPFNSRSPPSPNCLNATSTSELPKISVRKDILQERNMDTDAIINSESSKLETGFSGINVSDNIEESPLEKLEFAAANKPVQQINENTNCSNQFPENNRKECISPDITNMYYENASNSNSEACINENQQKSTSCITELSDTLQSTGNSVTSQDSQTCSSVLQPLEHCMQKRWKSPGEKKMMAEIQVKSSVIANPSLTFSSTSNISLAKYKSPTNEETAVQFKDTSNEINACVKSIDTHSTQVEKNVSTELQGIHQADKTVEDSNSTGSICIVALEPKLTSIETKTHNRTLKHQNTKQKKMKSLESKTGHETLNKQHTSNDNCSKDEKDTNIKVSDSVDIKNKADNLDLNKDHLKEYKKVKTAAEKKGTVPITKGKSSTYVQSTISEDLEIENAQTCPEVTSKTTKDDYTQTTVDVMLKTGYSKSLKDVNTQTTLENKSEVVTSKVAEKKLISASVRDTSIQTDTDSSLILKHTRNQLKQYRNIEVQATKLYVTTSVQTLASSDKCDNHTNYLDYIMQLKNIDGKIEQLMNAKQEIYRIIESKYNISSIPQTSTNEPIDTVGSSTKNQSICTINKVPQQENVFGASETTVLTKKHKKTHSDNEFEESMYNPKRKKRHKNSKRNLFVSQVNPVNKHNDVGSMKPSTARNNSKFNIEENSNDVRKPLSIKISLKNLMQSPSKREFEEVKKSREEISSRHITKKKSLEENCIAIPHDDTGHKVSAKTVSPAVSSMERKPRTTEDATGTLYKERKFTKSKNIYPNKHNLNLCNMKLSDGDYERIFNKKCDVIINRYTIENLEDLKKKLQKTRGCLKPTSAERTAHTVCYESDKSLKSDKLDVMALDSDSNNIHKTDFEFRNFVGAVLYMKVVQEVLLASTDNGCLYFFNVKTGDAINCIQISEKPLTSVCVVTNSDGCNVFLGCLMGILTILNFATKEITSNIQCEDGIQCLEKEWEYMFMGSHKGHVMRYNLKKNKLEQSLKIYDSNILAIKATQEGARRVLLVASRNTRVTVRDAMSGLLMRTLDSTFNPTVYTILLENSTVYCGTSQHDILVYTFQDGQLCHKYEAANSRGIVCLKIEGDLLFAGCYNGNIYVYSVSSKIYLGQITGPGGMLLSMDVHKNKIIVGTKTNKLQSLTIPQVFLNPDSS